MVSSEDLKKGAVSDKGISPVKLHGNPTVLVVDDEELIREVASMMIEEEGGTVLNAADGNEALKILAQKKDNIDCVFCDFSMPQMNGYEVFVESNKVKPDLPFVIVSGLKIVPEVDDLRRKGRIEFVSKPFHQVELVKAINKAREYGKAQ